MGVGTKPAANFIFFLGAGASVEAGVPDTYEMVGEFLNHVRTDSRLSKDGDLGKTVEAVVDTVKAWKDSLRGEPDKRVDVELLLDTLDKLDSKDNEVLLKFFPGGKFLLAGYQSKIPIIDTLRDFIKTRAIVDGTKISYLDPLVRYLGEFAPPLDIFSVNYDTAIEQFCSVHGKEMVDGFEVKWDPSVFNRRPDIRLYKLHGSVTWYRSERGEYLKVQTKATTDRIVLFTNEGAQSLILYPMRKWQYAEPLLELMLMLKHRLEETDICVVIGYSFRDDQITRIFWDAAQRNRKLHLILVSPHSPRIYDEKLKYFRERETELISFGSPLSERVICLPYKFGMVFPSLRERIRRLTIGLGQESMAKEADVSGDWPRFLAHMKYALEAFVEAEHVEKVNQILEGLDWTRLAFDWNAEVMVSFRMWFHAINRKDPSGMVWGTRFMNSISILSSDRSYTGADYPEVQLLVGPAHTQIKDMISALRTLHSWGERMLSMSGKPGDSTYDQLSGVENAFGDLVSFLALWEKRPVQVQEYLNLEVKGEDSESLLALKRLVEDSALAGTVDGGAYKKLVRKVQAARLDALVSRIGSRIGSVPIAPVTARQS